MSACAGKYGESWLGGILKGICSGGSGGARLISSCFPLPFVFSSARLHTSLGRNDPACSCIVRIVPKLTQLSGPAGPSVKPTGLGISANSVRHRWPRELQRNRAEQAVAHGAVLVVLDMPGRVIFAQMCASYLRMRRCLPGSFAGGGVLSRCAVNRRQHGLRSSSNRSSAMISRRISSTLSDVCAHSKRLVGVIVARRLSVPGERLENLRDCGRGP